MSITSNTDGAAVCPGQELILTCVAENTVALRWRIFNSHSSSFIEHTFTRRDAFGTREVEGVYTLILVSNTNNRFESTLSTLAMQSLHNTVTECDSTALINSFTIKIERKSSSINFSHCSCIIKSLMHAGIPNRPSNISSIVREYQSTSSTVEISWNSQTNNDPQVNSYHFQLIDRSIRLNELLMIVGNTSNTSVILDDLPYNHNLSFTLFVINCVGISPTVAHNINIGMTTNYCLLMTPRHS